jgi:hypothetical protein
MSEDKAVKLIKEFMDLLSIAEETDNGRKFYPVCVSSCRVLLTPRVNKVLKGFEEVVNGG